jgi:redox-sensing transcriptional repressor
MSKKVSFAVIRRLPKYYRYLDDLYAKGVTRISSNVLAKEMGLTASQIRQDLNCFGGFGQQGYGYNVEKLHSEIADILGLKNQSRAVLLGAGNLGRALINNFSFERCGFRLVAAFDVAPGTVGSKINNIPIYHLDKLDAFISENPPELAVLTLPASETLDIASRLEKLGVKGIWNFTNRDLRSEDISLKVENVHFADSLMTLCYMINGANA